MAKNRLTRGGRDTAAMEAVQDAIKHQLPSNLLGAQADCYLYLLSEFPDSCELKAWKILGERLHCPITRNPGDIPAISVYQGRTDEGPKAKTTGIASFGLAFGAQGIAFGQIVGPTGNVITDLEAGETMTVEVSYLSRGGR